MNSDRWTRVNEIFLAVADLPPEQRSAHLDEACRDDDHLRVEVELLLACDCKEDDPFLAPITEISGLNIPATDVHDPLLGRRVSHYAIRSLLGAGGMGRVYLATRVEDYFEQVVIKFLRRELAGDEVLRRFRNEMQIQAELGGHANIARLLDAGVTDDGLPFLVMEYVDGTEIDRYCNEHAPSVAARLHLFLGVCEAVQFAHQHAVIHRDLKPSNILVTPEGAPKLIDFGIAKLLGEEEPAAQTQTAYRALTPHYASPEHVQGRSLTTASDVYSLGVVLYELLTGRRPYRLTAKSAAAIERLICEQEPTRPSSAVACAETADSENGADAKSASAPVSRWQRQLVGDLDNIVLKALRKEPQHRYQSARQLADDIDRHLRGLPIRAQRPTWRYRAGKFVRRNKTGVIAAALILFLLVGGIIGTTTQWLDARDNAAAATSANLKLEANQRIQLQQLYVAHMNLVQQAWKSGSLQRMTDILDRYVAPIDGEDLRGFEWHYWKRMCKQSIASHQCLATPRCMAVSSQTDVAAVGASSGDVELWDLVAGKRIGVFSSRGTAVTSVAISHDGEYLASAHADRTITLWNLATREPIRTLEGHTLPCVGVAFSGDDRRLISAAGKWNQSGEVIVWDFDSGEQLTVEHEHSDNMKCLAVSPDGKTFATGGWDHRIVLWDGTLGKPIAELGKHDSGVLGVAFSPDGKTLASTGGDYIVKLWDLTTRELMFSLRGHAGEVLCVCFSPDAVHVATGGSDGAIKIWQATTGQLQATIVGHGAMVTGIAFNHIGKILTTAGADGSLKRWRLADVLDGPVLRGHDRAIYAIAFSPNGETLVSGGYDSTLRFWDVNSRAQTAQVIGKFGRVTSLAYAPDGAHIYSAHRGGGLGLRKWRVAGDQLSPTEIAVDPDPSAGDRPSRRAIEAVALSPSGDLIVATRWGGHVTLWSTSTWRPHFERDQRISAPGDIAFSPNGNWIATTSPYRVVQILDAATGQVAAELPGHEGATSAVAYSPDKKLLASGSNDSTIRLWNAETHQHEQTLRGHNGGIHSIAFSPDGTTLASGGGDTVVKLWDLDTGEQTTTLTGHTRAVTAVRFSPDGNTLASASEDSTIRLWSAR